MAHQRPALNKPQIVLFLSVLAAVLLSMNLSAQAAILDPLVSTGTSELAPDGTHVGVNVPAFFNMVLDTRGPRGSNKGFRLDETVMSGLVSIHVDRYPGPDGNMTGPIRVKVGGITMYDNGQTSASKVAKQ